MTATIVKLTSEDRQQIVSAIMESAYTIEQDANCSAYNDDVLKEIHARAANMRHLADLYEAAQGTTFW